jgi:putative serine protease PepD
VSSASAAPSPAASAPVTTTSGATPDWVRVAAAVEPSVVSVRVTGAGGSGEGSGVVLDTSGRVLTNNHVVAEAAGGGSISVVLSDGRTYRATIVGADPSTDLAVLKLDSPPSGLVAATFGDSAAVSVGQQVMAIGNPLGLSDTVTTGIVSAVNRPVTTGTSQQAPGSGSSVEPVVTNAIQTDAAINPGNSGGALVDSSGRVVGITSSIASLGASAGGQAGSIGLGFAIPSNAAKEVAAQLISKGSVQHAYLGVALEDGTVTVDGAQRQAAVIGSVSSGTPAARAGLQARDAVVAVNGQALDGADSLVARVRELKPDTTVTLTVVRDGSSREVQVTLAARPTTSG